MPLKPFAAKIDEGHKIIFPMILPTFRFVCIPRLYKAHEHNVNHSYTPVNILLCHLYFFNSPHSMPSLLHHSDLPIVNELVVHECKKVWAVRVAV